MKTKLLIFFLISSAYAMYSPCIPCYRCPEERTEDMNLEDYLYIGYWRNLKDKNQYKKNTALEDALTNKNWSCARWHIAMAIAIGANPLTAHNDKNAFHLALEHQDYYLLKFLFQLQPKCFSTNTLINDELPLFYTTNLDIAEILLDHGADAHTLLIPDFSSILHKTMCRRYPAELVKFYLEKKVNPNHQDNLGNTPLHNLCIELYTYKNLQELEQKTQLLLNSGADLNARNNHNETVEECAEDIGNTSHERNVRFFLKIIRAFKETKKPKKIKRVTFNLPYDDI